MFLWKVTGPDIVPSASVDANGFVRVDTRQNTSAGLVLELHHFFTPKIPQPTTQTPNPGPQKWGLGPFIAVKGGTSNLIDAVGGGIMIGFRSSDPASHQSFNLGIGYAAILSAQSLGAEFVEDQKAPVDSSGKPLAIRYVTHDAGSLMMMASFTF
jgi:hypothetical protein